jgi:hypothetical protein
MPTSSGRDGPIGPIYTGSKSGRSKSDLDRLLWQDVVASALTRILGVTHSDLLQNIPEHHPLDDEVRHAAVIALWKRLRGGRS